MYISTILRMCAQCTGLWSHHIHKKGLSKELGKGFYLPWILPSQQNVSKKVLENNYH